MLRDAGYEVEVAENLEQMVACLKGFTPDLCLVDVLMPQGFGYDLIDYLRNELKVKAPVVLFSSMAEHLLKGYAARYGAVGYILKGSDFGQLVDDVARVLNSEDAE